MIPTLRDVILLWGRADQVVRPVLLAESRAVAASKKIVTSDNLKPLPSADMKALRGKLTQAATGQNFSCLTSQDWRYSPYALEGAGGLLETPELLKSYLDALLSRARSRILRALATIYIKTFNSNSVSTQLLGEFIAKRTTQMGAAWNKAQLKYNLFHRDQVVHSLAKLLEAPQGSGAHGIADTFQVAGLPPILAHSNLALNALKQALETITRNYTKLSGELEARTIIGLTSDGRGGLALGGGSALVESMTDALLLPFQAAAPSPEIRRMLEDHLLRQLKDPRLHPAGWLGVRPAAKDVIHRWLTEQSLELFLEIVDKVVNKSLDAKRMWELRGRFWRSYLKKGYIDQAWVVLGLDGVHHARIINSSTSTENQNILSYGQLKSSSDVHKHIVLMMKIDSLTVVDWSHNGKCHIWTSSNPNAPKLYNLFYTRDQLVHLSEKSFTHIANGSWTHEVAKVIYQQTGRLVSI